MEQEDRSTMRNEQEYDIGAIEQLVKLHVGVPDNLENFMRSIAKNQVTSVYDLAHLGQSQGKPRLVKLANLCMPYCKRSKSAFNTAMARLNGHVNSFNKLKKRMSDEEIRQKSAQAIGDVKDSIGSVTVAQAESDERHKQEQAARDKAAKTLEWLV